MAVGTRTAVAARKSEQAKITEPWTSKLRSREIKLSKFVVGGRPEKWQAAQQCRYRFYKTEADLWRLELETESSDDDAAPAACDVLVSEDTELLLDGHKQTAMFYGVDSCTVTVWCLTFSSDATFDTFQWEFLEKQRENEAEAAGGTVDVKSPAVSAKPPKFSQARDEAGADAAALQAELQQVHGVDKKAVLGVLLGANDRSFVVHKGSIQVLKSFEGTLRGTGTSIDLKSGSKQELAPYHAMLAQAESKMSMLTVEKPTSLLQMDLEASKVVREWDAKLDGVSVPLKFITGIDKHAQCGNGSTFYALSDNCLMRWDARTKDGVVEELTQSSVKTYKSNPEFACMATSGETASGGPFIVVGAKDGAIRMYGARKSMHEYAFGSAKTTIDGLGLPITAIDVTFDASYVVATTDKHLEVLQTTFKDAYGRQSNCFVASPGASKPERLLLRLSHMDRAKGSDAKFSKAKFSWAANGNEIERYITAGCGSFTVVWSFRQVKAATQGALTVMSNGAFALTDRYTLHEKTERVVDSSFLPSQAATQGSPRRGLVVGTEHAVYYGDEVCNLAEE